MSNNSIKSLIPQIFVNTNLPECQYYANDEFTNEFQKKIDSVDLSIFHINIRSLNANKDKLYQLITAINNPFEVIALSEVWKFNISFYSKLFPNYNFYYKLPKFSDIGGVGVFIHDSYQVSEIDDHPPDEAASLFESLILEINKKGRVFILGIFYRHPSYKLTKFNNFFENYLFPIFNKFVNYNCFLIGDFNANIINYANDKEISSFLDVLINQNFMPLISVPTRIVGSSSSLLDHIYFRLSINKNYSITDISKFFVGCLVTDITDHLGVFAIIPLINKVKLSNDRPLIRIFSEGNKERFNQVFTNNDWNKLVFKNDDINVAYLNFINAINSCYEASFPLKKITRSKFKDKNWITPDLKSSCKEKSKKYKKWIVSQKDEDYVKFKQHATVHNKLIRAAKRKFYYEKFNSIKNNTKEIWKEINKVGTFNDKNTKRLSNIKALNVNDKNVA
jgi:hypothetical protein